MGGRRRRPRSGCARLSVSIKHGYDSNHADVDKSRYFSSTYMSSIERTIGAAPIPSLLSAVDENRITQLTMLTDTTTPAWYEASFSPEAGYYLLSYRGPNVPWQSVFSTTQEGP